jgi:hypothetical protein
MAGSAASAAVITQTQTISLSPNNIVQTQNFAQFDPARGTLTGVTVTASASQGPLSMRFTWNGLNPSASGRAFRYALDYTGSIMQGTNTIASGANQVFNPYGSIAGYGSIAAPAGYATGQSIIYSDPSWGLSIANVVNVLPGNFTPYIGVGTVAFDVRLENFYGISTPGGWGLQLTTNSQSSITVEYTYTPIPAPGAAAMLGLGGLLAARRRR